MIGSIKGKIVLKTEKFVLVETNGVGYKVSLSPEALSLIKQDEEIFEPAPRAMTKNIEKLSPHVEAVAKGAKLVIHRIGQTDGKAGHEAETPTAIEATLTPAEQPPINMSAEISKPTSEPEPPRITIIRRKIEEMVDVPLMDSAPMQGETAA